MATSWLGVPFLMWLLITGFLILAVVILRAQKLKISFKDRDREFSVETENRASSKVRKR
jgi:hypothetical protein